MRETGMNPYELMLSESQERMLIVLKPGREELARKIFEKWELDFAVIGHLTDTERMVLTLARRHRRQHPDPAAGHRGAGLRAAVDADRRCRPCSTPPRCRRRRTGTPRCSR